MANKITTDHIHELIDALADTRKGFAIRLQVTERAVYNWLTDNDSSIHPATASRIAKLYRKHVGPL